MARSPEYTSYIQSAAWREKSNQVISATGKRCALTPWKRATHAHHLHYKNLRSEWVVRDCVPLSPQAHKLIHWDIFWNLKGNRHTPSPLRPLVSNYLRVVTVCLIVLRIFLKPRPAYSRTSQYLSPTLDTTVKALYICWMQVKFWAWAKLEPLFDNNGEYLG